MSDRKKLVDGALYCVSVEISHPEIAAIFRGKKVVRWVCGNWIDEHGQSVAAASKPGMRPVKSSNAPTEWQVVLLRERVKALEKAGDYMAEWFPSSSTHRGRVVGQWREVRRARP